MNWEGYMTFVQYLFKQQSFCCRTTILRFLVFERRWLANESEERYD